MIRVGQRATLGRLACLLDFAFLAVCFVGFLVQVGDICQTYFAFTTTTLVQIEMPVELEPVDVSLCIRYVDLLSKESVATFYPSDVHVDMSSSETIQKIQNAITVEQIFNMTPSAQGMIGMCFLPLVGSYHVVEGNASYCNESFTIEKYYVQEYICYRFRLTAAGDRTYAYRNVVFSSSYPGMFYGLLLNLDAIRGADMCKVVVHEKNTLPIESLGYAPIFSRKVDNVEVYNLIKVGYSVTEIDLLPPPFDTACRWYAEFDELVRLCLDQCLTNLTLQALGKVPFSALQERAVPFKHVNNIDVMNQRSSKLLDDLDRQCNQNCDRPACETEHYSTFLQKEESSDLDQNYFTLLLQAPTTPHVNVTSGQRVQLSDFLVYVTSCFGTWWSISALTLSPLTLSRFASGRRVVCSCLFCRNRMQRLRHNVLGTRIFAKTK